MVEYSISKAFYKGACEDKIKVPSRMRFLCKEGEVGDLLYKGGYNHYLGIVEKEFSEGYNGETFGDYVIDVFTNVIMHDEVPSISSDELTSMLSKYHIYKFTEAAYNVSLKDSQFTYEKVMDERLYEACKILSIEGPFSVSVVRVVCNSFIPTDNTEVSLITTDRNVKIRSLCDERSPYLKQYVKVDKDDTLFLSALSDVMGKFSISEEMVKTIRSKH